MSLCERCKAFSLMEVIFASHSESRPEGWVHSKRYSTLKANSAQCRLCAILVGNLNAQQEALIQDDDRVTVLIFSRDQWPRQQSGAGRHCPLAGIEVRVGQQNTFNSVKHVPIWTDENNEMMKQFIVPRPVGAVTNETILKRWRDECLHNHPACRVLSRDTIDLTTDESVFPLPTRLIDVGDESTDPFLVEPKGLRGRYVALSHCWGKDSSGITKTETGTLEDHKQRIPIDSLSANFRDAIQVTRKLGYQYLWIDSLCIIQNRMADWEAESKMMAAIYTGASLTLAAANSSSANEGFLKPRQPPKKTVTLPFEVVPGMKIGECTIGEQVVPELFHDSFREDVERQSPLAKRGWTLQERLLSRRTIFFGRDEFHWECRSQRWSESTGLRPVRYVDVSAGLAAFRGLPIFGPTCSSVEQSAFLLNDWYMLVQEYTKRSLTKKHVDKLPALSGIARVVHAGLGRDNTLYRAGLWTHDLHRAVLWKSFGPELGSVTCRLPGPSWSWMSRDARIFPARQAEPGTAVDVDDFRVYVQPSGSGVDPYGMVATGTLSFRAYIRQIPSIKLIDPLPSQTSAPYPLTNALIYDQHAQQIGSVVLDDPTDQAILLEKLFAVAVRHTMTSQGQSIAKIEALLLQRLRLGGSYLRIGVIDMMGSNFNDERCKGAPFAQPFQTFFYNVERKQITIV
ncbi:heterokaryon incompatibility protein-domain-containing protein [Diplogelasinospora grovesii]|uniref:Heterokaryon incompatibility protein-domain-containing protein n=1 Tax=Diplogelasinospora grovesii TaxID=303347 RepID=A0AAN6NET9_9PEZI|nr:heterokaryon incompatibility protein-domain-containing protein [Diplogelasinospora grovesii]